MRLALLILCCVAAHATTYYVRTDGGTATQCTGLADAAYPGSGTGQACAWSHPFYALATSSTWRIAGGDTLLIGAGKYYIGPPITGITVPGTAVGEPMYNLGRATVFPALPSGPSAEQPTRIAGAGYNTGCEAKPQLVLIGGAYQFFYLGHATSYATGVQNTSYECLELTDEAQCGYGINQLTQYQCGNIYSPFNDGPWGKTGFYGRYATNVTLNNIWLHGLASVGWKAGPINGLTIRNTIMSGNPLSNFDGDFDSATDDSFIGTNLFEDTELSFGGCVERYPFTEEWTQRCVGWPDNYADGFGSGSTEGTWIFRRMHVYNNSQDGIDVLYLKPPGTMLVENSRMYNNGGNQLKFSGNALVRNNVLVGSCYWLTANMSNYVGMSHTCRAGGNTVAVQTFYDAVTEFYNNTITSPDSPSGPGGTAPTTFLTGCFYNTCNANTRLILKNNLFYGWTDYSILSAPYSVGIPASQSLNLWNNNYYYQMRTPCPYSASENGALCGATLGNPNIVNAVRNHNFDGRQRDGSPLIDAAESIGLSSDVNGTPRPIGEAPDIGAFEGSYDPPPPLVISTASPLPNGRKYDAYSTNLTATGGWPAYTWTITSGSLPTGLSMSSAGAITGTPTATGTSNFTVQVSDLQDPADTDSKALALTIDAVSITVTPHSLPTPYYGAYYAAQLYAAGGVGTHTWTVSAGSLCGGLTLSSSGFLSGSPTTAGQSCTFTAQAADTDSPTPNTGTREYSLTVGTASVDGGIIVTPGSTDAIVRYRLPGLLRSQTCTVVVHDESAVYYSAVDEGGVATRSVIAAGLPASTALTAEASCGTVSMPPVAFTTSASVSETRSVNLSLSHPTAASVRVSYGAQMDEQTTQACSGGCTVALTLSTGANRIRVEWLDGSGGVIGVSKPILQMVR